MKGETIYDPRHDYDSDHALHVETTDTGQLRLITIDGEQVSVIELDANGARALRNALTRWGRAK